MSGLRNVAGNKGASSIPMADSYLRAAHKIHVLLVDHEPEAFFSTAKMLELCGYGVTRVELASTAMKMLSRSMIRFDLVMANSNSPDNQVHKLLELSVTKNIPTVLLSFDDNIVPTMRAIGSGALLYLKKPVQMDILKYLWQLVLSWKRMHNTIRDHRRELFSTPAMNINCNNKNTNRQDIEVNKMVIDGAANVNNNVLGLGAAFRVTPNVNNSRFGLGDGSGDITYVNKNKPELKAALGVTSNVNNVIGLGAYFGGTTYVNNNRLRFGDGFALNTNVNNNGLQLGSAIGGTAYVNNKGLELGAGVGGTSSYANNIGLKVGVTFVKNDVELGAFGGRCNVDKGHEFGVGATANNRLRFGAVGGNYNTNNGHRFGVVGGSNGLELEATVGGGSSNVHSWFGLGGCNNINIGLKGGEVNNNEFSMAATNNKGNEILQVSSSEDSDDEGYYAMNNNHEEGYHKRKRKLGPGRYFPKEIKKLMNVPGLTRMQVASHLQKCRNQNYRLLEEQKSRLEIQPDSSASKSLVRSNNPTRARFGSMPKLSKTTGQSSRPDKPDRAGLLRNVTIDGRSSGPVNLVVGNGGGGHNYGAPMVPCQIITEMNIVKNSAPEGVETHHQVPPNPNYHEPDDDFFDFPSIEALLMQNISNPVQQANKNANCPGSRCGGSGLNVGGPLG